MSTQRMLGSDEPVMRAWKAYRESEEYANGARWAVKPEHTEGSLWGAFVAGFTAQQSTRAASEARGAEPEATYTVRACGGHWHVECGEFDVGPDYDTQAKAQEAADRLNAEPSSPTPAPAPGEAETEAEADRIVRELADDFRAHHYNASVADHPAMAPRVDCDVEAHVEDVRAFVAKLLSQLAAATRERDEAERAVERLAAAARDAAEVQRLLAERAEVAERALAQLREALNPARLTTLANQLERLADNPALSRVVADGARRDAEYVRALAALPPTPTPPEGTTD